MTCPHKPCPKCGEQMHRQSKKCRACYFADKAKPANYITRACAKCSEQFRVHVSQTARGQGRYCSRSCARSGSPARKRAPRPSLPCGFCGSLVERQRTELHRRVRGQAFCSPSCWYAHAQGVKSPAWTGGQDERMCREGRLWRKAVIARDKGYCRRCHSQHRPEAHHIVRFNADKRKRWELSNGVTLCRACHRLFQGREKEYERELSFIAAVPLVVWAFPEAPLLTTVETAA